MAKYKNIYSKMYFLKTKNTNSDKFGIISEVKSCVDQMISICSYGNRAIGISSNMMIIQGNYEIMEWKIEKSSSKKKKQEHDFLLSKPSFLFHKIKFNNVLVNSTMAMGLDIHKEIYVWGNHQDGLLGLGYNVTAVDIPTKLESLKNISEITMSETHALAIDSNGSVFAWGQGKYGELCLEKTIYSPFPTRMKSQKIYKKAFCGDLLTCLVDVENKFSYFGVIIKVFKKSNYKITFKNLWKDETNLDPNYIFKEKVIIELESEKINDILIANGFIVLLTEKGAIYTLDYSDNITLLYSRFPVYSSAISNNQLFSFSKDNNDPNSLYFTRWEPRSEKQSNEAPESWTSYLYKVREEFCKKVDLSFLSNRSNNLLLILHNSFNQGKQESNLGKSQIYEKSLDRSIEMNYASKFYESWDKSGFLGLDTFNNMNILIFISSFDDSYNIKYKRIKNVEGLRNAKSSTNLVNLSATNFERNLRLAEMKSNTSMLVEDNRLYFSNSSEKKKKNKKPKSKDQKQGNNKTKDSELEEFKLSKMTSKQYSDLSPIMKKKDTMNFSSYLYENTDKTQTKDIVFFNFQITNEDAVQDQGKSNIEVLTTENKVIRMTPNKVSDLYNFFEIIKQTFTKKYFYYLFGLKRISNFNLNNLIEGYGLSRNEEDSEENNVYCIKQSGRLTKAVQDMYLYKNINLMFDLLRRFSGKIILKYKQYLLQNLRRNQRMIDSEISNTQEKELIYVKTNILTKSPKAKNNKNSIFKKGNNNDPELKLIEVNPSNININDNVQHSKKTIALLKNTSEKAFDQLTLRNQNEVIGIDPFILNKEKLQNVKSPSHCKIIDKLVSGDKSNFVNFAENTFKSDNVALQHFANNESKNNLIANSSNDRLDLFPNNECDTSQRKISRKTTIQGNQELKTLKVHIVENEGMKESRVPKLNKANTNDLKVEGIGLTLDVTENENIKEPYSKSRMNVKFKNNIQKQHSYNPTIITNNNHTAEVEEIKSPTYFSKVKFMKKNETRYHENNEKNRKVTYCIENPHKGNESQKITNHNASINCFNNVITQGTIEDKELPEREVEGVVHNNRFFRKGFSGNVDINNNEQRVERINENLHVNISTIECKNSLVLSQNFDKTEIFSENYRQSYISIEKNNTISNSPNETLIKENPAPSKNKFYKKEKDILTPDSLFMTKCKSNENRLNEKISDLIANKDNTCIVEIFSNDCSIERNDAIDININENKIDFSKSLPQNRTKIEENIQLKGISQREEFPSKNLVEVKPESKPKNYNFNLDLQNVLNKLPKEKDEIYHSTNQIAKDHQIKPIQNNISNSSNKKSFINRCEEDVIKEMKLKEGFENSPKNNNLKRFTEQSPMKSLNDRNNRNVVDPEKKVKKSQEPTTFNVDKGSFSNFSKEDLPNTSSKQSENISLENSKENSKGDFVFSKFAEKNINLPLSTNFNNIIYTPRFKNRNNNLSQDTLNSENNSPGKKPDSVLKCNDIDELNTPMNSDQAPSQKIENSPVVKIYGKKGTKEESRTISNKNVKEQVNNTESKSSTNSKVNLKSDNSNKCELSINKEISIENKSHLPAKGKSEINKEKDMKSHSPQKNKEDYIPETIEKKEILPVSNKASFHNQNEMKLKSDKNVVDKENNKQSINKVNNLEKNSSHIPEKRSIQNSNLMKKLKENSPNRLEEKIDTINESSSIYNGNNSVYLRKTSYDKFSNKSLVINHNQISDFKGINESQNIYLNTHVFPTSLNKSNILNLDHNNSAIYFKPSNIDNFYRTNTNNTVELIMSNRSSNLNKREGNQAMKIEENEDIELKSSNNQKKEVATNKTVTPSVNKVFEEDILNGEKNIRINRKDDYENVTTEKEIDSSLEMSQNFNGNGSSYISKKSAEKRSINQNQHSDISQNKRDYSSDMNRHELIDNNSKKNINLNKNSNPTAENTQNVNDYNHFSVGDFKKFKSDLKPKNNNAINQNHTIKKESFERNNMNSPPKTSHKIASNKNLLNFPNKKDQTYQKKSKENSLNSFVEKDLKLNNSVNISKLNKVYETPKALVESTSKNNFLKTSHNESMISISNQKNPIASETSPNKFYTKPKKQMDSENVKTVLKITQKKQSNEYKNMVKMFVYLMEKRIRNLKLGLYANLKHKMFTLSPSISRTYIEYQGNNIISEKKLNNGRESTTNVNKKNLSEDFTEMNKKKLYSSRIMMKVIKRRIIFFKLIFINRVFQIFVKNQIHQINIEQIFFSNDDMY